MILIYCDETNTEVMMNLHKFITKIKQTETHDNTLYLRSKTLNSGQNRHKQ